jgi:hypothetical protein
VAQGVGPEFKPQYHKKKKKERKKSWNPEQCHRMVKDTFEEDLTELKLMYWEGICVTGKTDQNG